MKILKITFVFSIVVVGCILILHTIQSIKNDRKSILNSSEINIKEILFETDDNNNKPEFVDPFYCRQFMAGEKKISEKKVQKAAIQKTEIELPKCRIGGIVYNHENSMAIFISGEKSQFVKQGDVIDSIKIVSIMPQSIEVAYQGKKFKISQ